MWGRWLRDLAVDPDQTERDRRAIADWERSRRVIGGAVDRCKEQ